MFGQTVVSNRLCLAFIILINSCNIIPCKFQYLKCHRGILIESLYRRITTILFRQTQILQSFDVTKTLCNFYMLLKLNHFVAFYVP